MHRGCELPVASDPPPPGEPERLRAGAGAAVELAADHMDTSGEVMSSFAMETRSIHRNLSPLDHRYWQSNRELFDSLSTILSEEASVRYCARVEAALCAAHLRREGGLTAELQSALSRAAENIDPEEVAREEEKTQHNIRALVNVFQQMLPEDARPFVHLGATSADILDTASSLRVRDAVEQVILPLLRDVTATLCELSDWYADTVQIGRTHGQYAVPVTFGFALAEYAQRLSKCVRTISTLKRDLRGKLAGAVGAYNAMSMVTDDPEALEREVLSELGLLPGDQSNQLVEPEYMLRVLLELNTAFGILANLADDMRNLQRSELSEVRESFDASQVGSSTMPHKRNPWNWEHIKSLWKTYSPRVITFYMDQISEHQRDLTNSASSRFVAEYLAGVVAAFNRAHRILGRIEPDAEAMNGNINRAGDLSLAEPAYILLALGGLSDGHERVRQATLEAQSRKAPLSEVLRGDDRIWQVLDAECRRRTGIDAATFFSDVRRYRGLAASKARSSAEAARERIAGL